jgi:hypothetical protein
MCSSFLRIRAAVAEEVAADDHGLQVGLDHQALAEFFRDDHRLDRAAAEAAFFFREGCAKQAEFSELRPHLGAPAGFRFRDLAARVKVVLLANKLRATVSRSMSCSEVKLKSMEKSPATPSRPCRLWDRATASGHTCPRRDLRSPGLA